MVKTALPLPASIATAEAALALYDLARTTGAASCYEAAAHALARALQREKAKGAAFGRPGVVSPVLGAPCEPVAVAAPKKRSAKVQQRDDDLTALFARPSRAKAGTGSFWCVWDDGTATRVSGVIFHAARPETRWAAAFQAADALRRLRARHDYARQLETMADCTVRSLQARTSCGIMVDSPEWQRLAAVRPMAALASIHDELDGQVFTPPAGGRFGAGDAGAASLLEAALVPARLFWRRAEIVTQGGHVARGRDHSAGVSYLMSDGEAVRVADGDSEFLAARRGQVRAALEEQDKLTARPALKATASGANRASPNLHDLDGAAVVMDADLIALRIEAADRNERGALEHFARIAKPWVATSEGQPIRYTLARLAGSKAFRLTASDGACVTWDAQHVAALRMAA